MFVAVLVGVLFMMLTYTGSYTADSCTALLPPLVITRGEGDGCPASEGEELMSRINISALLEDALHCVLPGHTPDHPANSCAELAEQEPDIPSGTTGSSTPHSHQSKCSVKWVKCFQLVSMSPEAG